MATGAAGPRADDGKAEKRLSERIRRRLMVRYGTRVADKTGFTRNISGTGMFLQTNTVLQPGTTIQVYLKLPDREFTMWARVMWAKTAPPQLAQVIGSGMGIQFIEPSQEWLDYYQSSTKD